MLIFRTGKERIKNMFDVKTVQLKYTSGRNCKYGIGTVNSYGDMGGRVCDRYHKIFI